MKRFLVVLLALIFSLPVCRGVLAFSPMSMDMNPSEDVGHSETMTTSWEILSSVWDESVSVDLTCNHQSTTSSHGMNCCNSDADHSKIGVWERWTSEKSVKSFWTIAYRISTDTNYKSSLASLYTNHPSTAPPPDRQSYPSLVGIVKRLD